jgi:g-D-glutamyl-meso-diaminopimelate peptidase
MYMEELWALALRRAGAADFASFQRQQGLRETGTPDEATIEALAPYLMGYQIRCVAQGDTYYRLAREYGTTVAAIDAANPGRDVNNLRVGSLLIVPFGFPVVPTDVPFTSQLLKICVRGLLVRYPFLQAESIGCTRYGRPIWMLHIGTGSRTALYNASHHANEWITTPVVLHFLEEYCAAYVADGELFGRAARELYTRTTLHLAPMVNPDGVDLVTGAATEQEVEAAKQLAANYPDIPFPNGWKANLAGVDLNLQYPAEWEQAKQIKFEQGYTKPGPRDFVGTAPLTQPESAALYAHTQSVQPNLTLSYHTQGRVIYWRFLDYDPPRAEEIGQEFQRVSGYALEDTPYASGFAGYKDWFIQQFNRPGYTIECGTGESPLPLSQFDEIYANNLGILTLGLAEA